MNLAVPLGDRLHVEVVADPASHTAEFTVGGSLDTDNCDLLITALCAVVDDDVPWASVLHLDAVQRVDTGVMIRLMQLSGELTSMGRVLQVVLTADGVTVPAQTTQQPVAD